MNNRASLIFVFVATLVLSVLFAVPAVAASDPARDTAFDAGKAEAATLLEKGKAAEAYDLYMRLVRIKADDDTVNLGLARAATRSTRWNQAVMAYEMLLEKYPKEAGLYGEIANVYMLLGDRTSAERSLAMMRSLDGSVTPQDTEKALDILESRYSQLQIHGKVSAGMLYDSNANMGPRSNTMDLGNWRGITVQDAREKDTFGGYLSAELNMGWRLEQDSPWWLVGDAHVFLRGNTESDLRHNRSRESQWGRLAVGMRHLSSSTLTELRLKGEIFDYELFQNVSSLGPEGTFLWTVTPNVQLITRAAVDHRIYSKDSARNGTYGWLGEYVRFFFGAANHEFIAGVRYLAASADRGDYSHDGWEASARFLFKLPYGFELGPFASFTQEKYNGPATVLESTNRKDSRWRLGTSLTYRINEAWSVECRYQYTRNDSRSNLYDYDQHLVTTGVAWSF